MSKTDELMIMPRPRSPWQAIDVGFKIARAHYLQLLVLWMTLALPFLFLAEMINLMGTLWGIAFWWWFKPFYELPLLLYLSKVIFSEDVQLKDCIRQSLRQFWTMMKTFTGLSRLSLTRSTTSPIVFLEKLKGDKRRSRAQVLTDGRTHSYTMMLGCLHVEFILTYTIIAIALLLAPEYLEDIIPDLLTDKLPITAQFLADSTVVIASGLVAPFFVSAGFIIYINRRMRLEAWDVEHQFKQISASYTNKARVGISSISALAILCIGLFIIPSEHSHAVDKNAAQEITLENAKADITSVLADRDFGGTDTRRVPKFIKDADKQNSADISALSDFINALATALEVFLWLAAFLTVVLIVQFIIRFVPDWNISETVAKPKSHLKSAEHHPLTQTLPDDIASQAKALLAKGDNRGAISMLFRGALRFLMNEHNVEIATSATEQDCISTLQPHADIPQITAFSQLVRHWQREAYAHIYHSQEEVTQLITDWENNFSKPSVDRS